MSQSADGKSPGMRRGAVTTNASCKQHAPVERAAEGLSSHSHRNLRLLKEVIFAIAFVLSFILLDGASTTAQAWEGAPPCYLPVALSLALMLWSGRRYVPLMFLASIVAGAVNYHRPLLSWSGITGSCAVYAGYVVGAYILKKKWPIDTSLRSLRDIGRFVLVSFGGAVVSTAFGVLAMFLDGIVRRDQLLHTSLDWYASDIIGIVTICPFLLIFIAPRVGEWLDGEKPHEGDELRHRLSFKQASVWIGQTAIVAVAIWILFCIPAATPYQPLYLLFVPLIWTGLRRGIRGTAFITFVIGLSITIGAGLTHAPRGSLPHLQLASLILGLTGLCVGAIVSERTKVEEDLRHSEKGLKES